MLFPVFPPTICVWMCACACARGFLCVQDHPFYIDECSRSLWMCIKIMVYVMFSMWYTYIFIFLVNASVECVYFLRMLRLTSTSAIICGCRCCRRQHHHNCLHRCYRHQHHLHHQHQASLLFAFSCFSIPLSFHFSFHLVPLNYPRLCDLYIVLRKLLLLARCLIFHPPLSVSVFPLSGSSLFQ